MGKYLLNAENGISEVEIIDKAPTPRMLGTLKVMSLVECEIPVRICYVYDGSYGSDVVGNVTRVRDAFRITEQIIDHLNYVFRQACVRFEAHPSGSPLRVDYDGWRDANNVAHNQNDRLDMGFGDFVLDAEATSFDQLGLDTRIPTLFIVNQLTTRMAIDALGLTATRNRSQTRWAFVQTLPFVPGGNQYSGPLWDALLNQYLHTCAYEMGHILDISKRDYGGWTGKYEHHEHDAAVWPWRYNQTRTLMNRFVSSRRNDAWIRNEDWNPANENARTISFELQP